MDTFRRNVLLNLRVVGKPNAVIPHHQRKKPEEPAAKTEEEEEEEES